MEQASTSFPEPWNGLLSRVRSWALQGLVAVGVGFLYVLLLQSISSNVSPFPDALSYVNIQITDTEERCTAAGGTWTESAPFPSPPSGIPTPPPLHGDVMYPPGFFGTCQGPFTADREREAQTQRGNLVQFLTFTIGGGVALLVGLALLRMTPVAPALMVAGVLAFRAIGSSSVITVSLGSFGGWAHLAASAAVFVLLLLAGDFLLRRRRR